MKASRKHPTIAHTIVSIVLLIALLCGIGLLVNRNNYQYSGGDYAQGNIIRDNIMEYTLDNNLSNVDIRSDFGNVNITSAKDGEEPRIEILGEYKPEAIISYKNGECKIKFVQQDYWFEGMFGNWADGKTHTRIDIYLPSHNLKSLNVESNAGSLDISKINTEKLDVEMLAGDVKVTDSYFVNVEVDVSAGKMDLYLPLDVKNVECDVSAGNLQIYVPDNINGFVCSYDITAGDFNMNADYDEKSGEKNEFVNRKGAYTKGDLSCKMKVDISAGNATMSNYFDSNTY